jgi:hypothetical protein
VLRAVVRPEFGQDGAHPAQACRQTVATTARCIVDFSICPHLAQDGMQGNPMAEAEQWAAGSSAPAYAMDDETAIKLTDGTVEVVSEGHWRLFPS